MFEQLHTTLPADHPARARPQASLRLKALSMTHREIRLVQAARGEEPCCGTDRRHRCVKADCPWELRCLGAIADWHR